MTRNTKKMSEVYGVDLDDHAKDGRPLTRAEAREFRVHGRVGKSH